MVLPEIHPGPYHPVGGSNIPYLIYKNLDSSAMVMHSISDHSLNLPSKNQVENYLENLDNCVTKEEGLTCTEPVTVQISN
jgi:putative membrane protein